MVDGRGGRGLVLVARLRESPERTRVTLVRLGTRDEPEEIVHVMDERRSGYAAQVRFALETLGIGEQS